MSYETLIQITEMFCLTTSLLRDNLPNGGPDTNTCSVVGPSSTPVYGFPPGWNPPGLSNCEIDFTLFGRLGGGWGCWPGGGAANPCPLTTSGFVWVSFPETTLNKKPEFKIILEGNTIGMKPKGQLQTYWSSLFIVIRQRSSPELSWSSAWELLLLDQYPPHSHQVLLDHFSSCCVSSMLLLYRFLFASSRLATLTQDELELGWN